MPTEASPCPSGGGEKERLIDLNYHSSLIIHHSSLIKFLSLPVCIQRPPPAPPVEGRKKEIDLDFNSSLVTHDSSLINSHRCRFAVSGLPLPLRWRGERRIN